MWDRLGRALRDLAFRRESASGIARGVTAGLIAVALPISVVRVALAFLLAAAVRGSKRSAVLLAAASLAVPVVPATLLQFQVGCWFWPGSAAGLEGATAALAAIDIPWSWVNPVDWLRQDLAVLSALTPRILGPLALGMGATAVAATAVGYPLTVIGVWTWRAWRHRWRVRRRGGLRQPPPLVLPGAREMSREEALARYARKPGQFPPARGVELLVDGGRTFASMLEAIDAARQSVDLETYILRDDGVGRRFQEALCRAARRGVGVRLLYDYIGSLSLPTRFVDRLLEAGVAVGVYNPPALRWLGWRVLDRRNHRKTLIVDGQVTFTGGLNLADDYAPAQEGGAGWRDTHVRIDGTGPADQATMLFRRAWRKAALHGAKVLRRRRLQGAFRRLLAHWRRDRDRLEDEETTRQDGPSPARGGGAAQPAVRLLGNHGFGERHRIHQAYLHAIRRARSYILIENAYFIPSRAIRRALAKAVRRGVVVAVAVARDSDVKIAACAGRYLYSRLLASGVRLFEWPFGMLHAKTAVIDDAWSIVGSYNMDHRSLFHQLESAAAVVDAAFARRLRDQTLADMSQSPEVTLERHESRPIHRMVLESAAYLVRHWL
jgi:cardiolipin synthase